MRRGSPPSTSRWCLVIFGLIIRGVSFEYRGKIDTPRWKTTWSTALTVGSLMLPVLLGIALGDLLYGLPIDSSGEYTGSFWNLLTPYGLWVGITLLSLTLLHGSTFLTLRTTGIVHDRARRLTMPFALVAIVTVLVFTIWTQVLSEKGDIPGPLQAIPLIAIVAAAWAVRDRHDGWAFSRDRDRDRAHDRDDLRRLVPERHGLEHELGQQPHGREHRVGELRAEGHDGRRGRAVPRRARLPDLELPRLPAPDREPEGRSRSPLPPSSPTGDHLMSDASPKPSVVIVGAGFAGVACAKELAKHDVPVTLIDRHNYQQFQPLLYQVATAELGTTDIARPIRAIFAKDPSVSMRQLDVTGVDPETRTVTTADGQTFTGDYVVVAAGTKPNFFNTPGAAEHAFPLYSVPDAKKLRGRVFELFEEAASNHELIDAGALNFVIVGAGPTGVETAGALADLVNEVMPKRYHNLDVSRTRIYLVDHGQVVLRAFSDKAHEYAAGKLQHNGVTLMLGIGVKEVDKDKVILSDGTEILTRCVIWGGGIQASTVAGNTGLASGRGGCLTAEPDLPAIGYPNVFVIGDIATIPDHEGKALPQLGSVALQSGHWAAENILADMTGKPRTPFHYKDKGIMAMIGDGAAVAEMGKHHHELHGHVAFCAWLGVHAYLMSGSRTRIDAFIAWASDFIGSSRASSIIDDPDAARIDWGDEEGDDEPLSDAPPAAAAATTLDGRGSGVLGAVGGQQPQLVVVLREHEPHEHRAEGDGDESRGVGPLLAVDERLLGRGDDL